MKITRILTRYYSDNRQLSAYVEWSNGSRTEGKACKIGGAILPIGEHMKALFARATREGLIASHETW